MTARVLLLAVALGLAACAAPAPVRPTACAEEGARLAKVAELRAGAPGLPSLRYIEANRRRELSACLDREAPPA